jgi:hypothetical protein
MSDFQEAVYTASKFFERRERTRYDLGSIKVESCGRVVGTTGKWMCLISNVSVPWGLLANNAVSVNVNGALKKTSIPSVTVEGPSPAKESILLLPRFHVQVKKPKRGDTVYTRESEIYISGQPWLAVSAGLAFPPVERITQHFREVEYRPLAPGIWNTFLEYGRGHQSEPTGNMKNWARIELRVNPNSFLEGRLDSGAITTLSPDPTGDPETPWWTFNFKCFPKWEPKEIAIHKWGGGSVLFLRAGSQKVIWLGVKVGDPE